MNLIKCNENILIFTLQTPFKKSSRNTDNELSLSVFCCIYSYFLFGGKSAGKNSKSIRLPPAYSDFPQKSRNPLCHNDLGTYFDGFKTDSRVMFYCFFDLTYAEIAKQEGCSLTSVRQSVKAAESNLKK